MSGQPVMVLDKVSKRYGAGDTEVVALDQASLELRAGELVGIIGPSGAGKTTFLLIAGLLDAPTSGTVYFKGNIISEQETDLNELRDFRRRHVGFVFQKPNLIPFLNAVQNVQVALEINDVRGAVAERRSKFLLEQFGVGHRAENLPVQLSGGEQQRVAIARSLANRPDLILADEPTASLDSVRGRQVMQMFRDLVDQGDVSICVVTHDTRLLNFFDRLVEMNDGRIVNVSATKAAAPMINQEPSSGHVSPTAAY